MGEMQKMGAPPNTCMDVLAGCMCTLPEHEGGAHVCPCEGSWEYNDEGEMRILNFPQGMNLLPVPGPWSPVVDTEEQKAEVREQWVKHKRLFGDWPTPGSSLGGYTSNPLAGLGLLGGLTSTFFGDWYDNEEDWCDDDDDEGDGIIETTAREVKGELGKGEEG